MTRFMMENFGGEIPRLDNRLLPDNTAALSINTWLRAGRIEPAHSLINIYTCVSPATRSVFRLPISSPYADYMVNSYWLEFENQNVRVIRSPVTGQDDDGRYYWADGVYPKMMTGTMIQQAGGPFKGTWDGSVAYHIHDRVTLSGINYTATQENTGQPPVSNPNWMVVPTPIKLGVPLPTVPPGVTPSGGVSSTAESRAYTYTWVTANGEEGPPVGPGTATGKLDDTWHITMTAPSSAETANRNLTNTRIYRSVTSTQGVASYFFVVELPIATLTYADTQTDAIVALNNQLQSLSWSEPPADLQQLVAMPNGMVAGFRKNEVWFCEQYYPHAWPLAYKIAVPTDIVGLGVLGQTLMILTSGNPWAAVGIEPSNMALQVIQPLEACTSMLSIVNTPNGVLYCSSNGLINITASGAMNVTRNMLMKEQWSQLLNLPTVAAGMLVEGYFAWSIADVGVFQNSTSPPDSFNTFQQDTFQEKSHFGTQPGVFIALSDPHVALSRLNPPPGPPTEVQNVITDLFNGEIMLLRDGVVYFVDIRNQSPYALYTWRSKMFKTTYLENLAAAKVYWTPPFPTIDGSPPGDTYFRFYAAADSQQMEDGLTLRFEEKLTQSGQMFRLPSGYKALYHQVEIEGYAIIDAIHVASTARELRAI